MSSMERPPIFLLLAGALLAGQGAYAQTPNNLLGGSLLSPPLPRPLPPPKITVPVVPKLDAPLQYDYRPAPRPSFSDRVVRCLEEGAVAGLGPADRAAYSRSCANQQ
jgi:hypothetical protein